MCVCVCVCVVVECYDGRLQPLRSGAVSGAERETRSVCSERQRCGPDYFTSRRRQVTRHSHNTNPDYCSLHPNHHNSCVVCVCVCVRSVSERPTSCSNKRWSERSQTPPSEHPLIISSTDRPVRTGIRSECLTVCLSVCVS